MNSCHHYCSSVWRLGVPCPSLFDGLFSNPFIWIATLIVVLLLLLAAYFGSLSQVLGTVKPSAMDWVVVCSCGLLAVGIVEVTKLVFRARHHAWTAPNLPSA